MGLTGCTSPDESPPGSNTSADGESSDATSQTTRQTQLVKNGKLGDSIDMAEPPKSRVTPNSCVGVKRYEFENVRNWDAKAFYTYDMKDVEREIEAGIDGGVDLKDLGVTGAFDYYYQDSATKEKRVLALVAHVQTVKQYFEAGGGEGAPRQDLCQLNNYPATSSGFKTFKSDCGTGYISQETMGGYIVLTSRVTSLSGEEKQDLDININANSGPITGGLNGAINAVSSTKNINLEFRLRVEGLPEVPDNLYTEKNGGKYIEPSDVLNYISSVNSTYQQVLNDPSRSNEDKLYDPAFGQVIDESYQPYAADTLEQCGFTNSSKNLLCYTNTMDDIQEFQEDREGYLRVLAKAQWVSNHRGTDRVRWIDTEDTDDVTTGELIERLNRCTGPLLNYTRSTCRETYLSGYHSELCAACSIPRACNPGVVDETIANWQDDFVILPPGPTDFPLKVYSASAPSPGESPAGEPVAGWLCTLSKVQGGFFGGGEALKVTENPNGNWELYQETARTKEDELNHGTMHCVRHSNFTNYSAPSADAGISADAGTGCWRDTGTCQPSWSQKKYSVSTSNDADRRMKDSDYAAALMGIEGNFGGYGEKVRTNQFRVLREDSDSADSWLSVNTAAGYIRGWGVSFGLDNPEEAIAVGQDSATARPRTEIDARSKIQTSQTLGHTDEKFCFLTRVTGEFDGPTERARVYRDGATWVLSARSACAKNKGFLGMGPKCKKWKKLKATARCYAYDHSGN